MTPAVEVFTFQASKAYQKDPSVLNPVLDIVADWKGSLGCVDQLCHVAMEPSLIV